VKLSVTELDFYWDEDPRTMDRWIGSEPCQFEIYFAQLPVSNLSPSL